MCVVRTTAGHTCFTVRSYIFMFYVKQENGATMAFFICKVKVQIAYNGRCTSDKQMPSQHCVGGVSSAGVGHAQLGHLLRWRPSCSLRSAVVGCGKQGCVQTLVLCLPPSPGLQNLLR